MPQLDPLIWINLCYNNTLFFWILYYLIVRIVLIRSNALFYLRNNLKEYSFLHNYIKINNLFLYNFNFITNEIIYIYILNKKRYLISILSLYCKYKDKINNIIYFISNKINKNNYLFSNYIYNNIYYLLILQNINFNIKN